MNEQVSNKLKHFFHVVSNIRPIVWIGLYVAVVPVFALVYWLLPDGQFRIPDGGTTDFGSWIYYSIVTITTLGFGDYTPMHGWSQTVTAIEVMCGLIFLGLFLNAVGSMKSEIDVESEIEKQRRLREEADKSKLLKNIPRLLHQLNIFLSYCYAVTTPESKRNDGKDLSYNPDFKFSDLADMFKPSGLPTDPTEVPAVERLIASASTTSLVLDSLQNSVDLRQWPEILEDCFSFVANYQMFSSTETLSRRYRLTAGAQQTADIEKSEEKLSTLIAGWQGDLHFGKEESQLRPVGELFSFIKENGEIATRLETLLTSIALDRQPQ